MACISRNPRLAPFLLLTLLFLAAILQPVAAASPKHRAKPTQKRKLQSPQKRKWKPQSKRKWKPQPKRKSKPQPKRKSKPQPKRKSKPQQKRKSKPQPKPKKKHQPKSQPTPQKKPQRKIPPKPQQKPQPQKKTPPKPRSQSSPKSTPRQNETLEEEAEEEEVAKPIPHICGIALSTGHDLYGYRQSKTGQTISQIKTDGATHVQISAYTKQIGAFSTIQHPQTDDQSLEYIIRKVQSRGLKVFLKPTVSVESPKGKYIWRGHLKGSDKWFTNLYIPYMQRMARLAQRLNVDILSVGSEFRDSVHKTRQWLRVIEAVRDIYKGKLTYIANHDIYDEVQFFHLLDFISLSAYYKLLPGSRGASPTLARTKQLFQIRVKRLENWRRRMGLLDKQVLVAEVGWQSKGNGVVYRLPWDWNVKAPPNYWEQAKMYEGFFSTFLKPDWMLGVMMWHYELDNSVGRSLPSKAWYTPQNKPAQKVLQKYFSRFCSS